MTPSSPASPLSSQPARLRQISIASPCPANWDGMTGTEQVRFCNQCSLHVYNISAMRSDEVDALFSAGDGICIRMYQRPDGTLISSDCPRGVEKIRRRLRWAARAVAGMLAVATGGWVFSRHTDAPVTTMGEAKMGAMVAQPPALMGKPVMPAPSAPTPSKKRRL